jgi:putative transposase
MPNRPPRLEPFQKYDSPLYFVTFNTHQRHRLLANKDVHSCFVRFADAALERGITVGRYVIMPDHIHLFVSGHYEFFLTEWIRTPKRTLSTVIPAPRPHWQKGFFDHLIRHGESYSEKWEYVFQNPVRAGLVRQPDDWPWQGEIETI